MYKKHSLLLLISLLIITCQGNEFSFNEENEELSEQEFDHENAARILSQFNNQSIESIAQQKNVSPEAVANALLWMQEHPTTPMPNTPFNYTADEINEASKKFSQQRAQRKADFNKLNKQEIMRATGASEQDINKAFGYYRHALHGQVPNTLERIEQLAKMYENKSEGDKEYKGKNRKKLQELDKDKIMEQTRASEPDIDKAFKYYQAQPLGQVPNTLERIEQLAKAYENKSENHRKLKVKRKTQDKEIRNKKQIKLETSLVPLAQKSIDQIAAETGMPTDRVLAAFNMHKRAPDTPFPEDVQELTNLANKWDEHVRERKTAFKKRKTE